MINIAMLGNGADPAKGEIDAGALGIFPYLLSLLSVISLLRGTQGYALDKIAAG